ncbi:MAG: two-component hybrid sensor and regulator [Fibrobacteres bacterium]|nr:two-component hybrid sensor and regulator [Fibrobacterota bacterium]
MPDASIAKLLIVDDEAAQLKALSFTLQDAGFTVMGFTSPREALASLEKEKFDLLLTDLKMPDMDGLAVLRSALEFDRDLVVIVMTGHGSIDTAVEAMKAGALDYILKPFKLSAILPILDRALSVRRLRLENALLVERIKERTAELEAANKELEAFSYSISHDLRAPLRHVNGFAAMLTQRFAADLPAEAKRLLGTVVEGAKRMERLIDDLLQFSRLSRQPLTRRNIDMSMQVKEILGELGKAEPDRSVDWQVGDLPPRQGDPALIRQVWVNLLSNAFKFTGKREAAEIEVGCTREGDELVYFVRDNGAGFDMAHVDKMFGVFQRFHNAQEFEGTGVGLSIVQRIIQRHGGRIWAQAAVGEGATFLFVLPDPA